MAAEDQYAIVEDLLSLPFPQERARAGSRSSGPGYHVRVLQASQDFWDGRGEETVEAAEQEIGTAYGELVTILTARWGSPETVDLEPYLWAEDPAPGPINELCQISGQILIWRRPEASRWVGLAIGQADPEFPIELLAAVGAVPVPQPL